MMLPLHKSKNISFFGLASLAFVCLLLTGRLASAQTAPTAPLPIPRDAAGKVTPVGDFANVIDDATEQKLADILKNLADKQGIEYAVVTVNSTNGQEIFDYSLALMRGWGVGSEEKQGQAARPGLLTLIAVNDRKFFTQVSRHLEGDLPDSVVAQIHRQHLVPLVRQGRYSEALAATTQAFVGEMARKRSFSVEGLDQKYVRQTPVAPRSGSISAARICGCLVILLIVLIILFIISRKSGGGNSSGWGGGGFGGNGRYDQQSRSSYLPVPIILGGGWGGGGGDSGGGSDWGSSDWGGFSGGGGDAGGGGAGGDW